MSHRASPGMRGAIARLARLFRYSRIMLACGAIAALATSRVGAQTIDSTLWITNGSVRAMVRSGNTLFVGGTFTYVGPHTGAAVPVDGVTGAPASAFPKVVGTVRAAQPDGAGGWWLGGDFTRVGAFARNGLAHVLADGSVAPWNPGVTNGGVYALAVSGATVYAAGTFDHAGGLPRMGLAAIEAVTGNVTAWDAQANGAVGEVAVVGGTVFAGGGGFTTIGGQSVRQFAALDAGTALATLSTPAVSVGKFVYALAASGGTVYVGGDFSTVGGQPRNGLAAIDATTGALTAWNAAASAGADVQSLAVSGVNLLVGGNFTSIGGQSRRNLAALDAVSAAATAWNPDPDGEVSVVTAAGASVYVTGGYTHVGALTRSGPLALDAVTGVPSAWAVGTDGGVTAMVADGAAVMMCGTGRSFGGRSRSCLAALDATTGAATAWNAGLANGFPNQVNALAVSGGRLYVGGRFQFIGGIPRNVLAAVDATTGFVADWIPAVGGSSVESIVVADGRVYAASTSGFPGQVAAFDATTAATLWSKSANAPVRGLARAGSSLVAVGEFTTLDAQARNRVGALDPATGAPRSYNVGATGPVYAIAADGATVYMGGNAMLSAGNGEYQFGLGAYDAETGTPQPWNASPNGAVSSLTASGSRLLVGGAFTTIGGQSRRSIASLDRATASADTWDPSPLFAVGVGDPVAFHVSGQTVYVSGDFALPTGVTRPHYAGFVVPGLAVDAGAPRAVTALELAAGPNPVRDRSTFRFALPSAARVSLGLFDLAGRRVATLLDDAALPAGAHQAGLDARALPAGVYLARLSAGADRASRKVMVLP